MQLHTYALARKTPSTGSGSVGAGSDARTPAHRMLPGFAGAARKTDTERLGNSHAGSRQIHAERLGDPHAGIKPDLI